MEYIQMIVEIYAAIPCQWYLKIMPQKTVSFQQAVMPSQSIMASFDSSASWVSSDTSLINDSINDYLNNNLLFLSWNIYIHKCQIMFQM